MKDKITVIIPVFNRENSIEKTIESVENQNCKDFSILIIDDGSSDRSKDIILKLMEKYKNIDYKYKENGGVSSARNLGIKLSKTKYISFLDSDDFYDEHFIKEMLTKIKNDKSDICACGFCVRDKNGKRRVKNAFKEENILYNYILGKNNFHTSSFVFSRKFLLDNKIYFDEALSWGEDIKFFIKAMSNSKDISLVKRYLTTYMKDSDDIALSSFSLYKNDLDYKFIKHILKDQYIKLDRKEKDCLINYKFVGLITYRLIKALNMGYDKKDIRKYYEKYRPYLKNLSMKHGLRSIKLWINLNKLEKSLNI